jgi:hypothetical protein
MLDEDLADEEEELGKAGLEGRGETGGEGGRVVGRDGSGE